jgi:lipoprotein-anchoring transpeptidase ErfK/SrfK
VGAAGVALALAAALAGCGSSDDPALAPVTVTAPAPGTAGVGEAAPGGESGEAQTTTATEPEVTTPADPPDGEGASTAKAPSTASQVEAAPSAEPPVPETTLTLDRPRGAYPVIWVRAGAEVRLRTEAGGGQLVTTIDRRTEFGSPSVFGVVEQRGRWAGVTTSLLTNGRLGWIRLDPESVQAGWTRYSIVVDLSARSAELQRNGDRKLAFPVTIGAPGTDTPAGRFAVTDTFTDLNSVAYGCCALALSANQPNLPSGWLGGRRIAIHGTVGPLGVAASHGCVRAADDNVAELVRTVPLGTPVFVRA